MKKIDPPRGKPRGAGALRRPRPSGVPLWDGGKAGTISFCKKLSFFYRPNPAASSGECGRQIHQDSSSSRSFLFPLNPLRLCASARTFFLSSLLLSFAPFSSSLHAALNENLIASANGGVIVNHGAEGGWNGSFYAERIFDGSLTYNWAGNTYSNKYFIFSFSNNDTRVFSQLKIHRLSSSAQNIKGFRLFSSMDNMTYVPITGSTETSPINLLNRYLGTTILSHGSEKYGTADQVVERLNDGNSSLWGWSGRMISQKFVTYDLPGSNQHTLSSFKIYNHNDSSAVKEFRLYASEDNVTFQPITGSQDTNLANLLSYRMGGTLLDNGHVHNASGSVASRVHDSANGGDFLWQGRTDLSIFFTFEIASKKVEPVSTLKIVGTSNNKCVKDFTFYTSEDNVTFQQVTGGTNEPTNLLHQTTGAILEAHGSENKYSIYEYAEKLNNGDISYANWSGDIGSSYFIYSFRSEQAESMSSFFVYNYGDSKSVNEFKLFTSNDEAAKTDINHVSWQAIPSGFADDRFSAALTAGKQTFAFAPVSAKYFKFLPLTNHGGSGFRMKEIQLEGTKLNSEVGVFRNPNTANVTTYNFTPIQARYFKWKALSNYGYSYTALSEIELYGTTQNKDLNVFRANMGSGFQTFNFDPLEATFFKWEGISSHGVSSSMRASELKVYGDTTYQDLNAFKGTQGSGFETFNFDSTQAKYFKIQILDNQGNSSSTAASEMQLFSTFNLSLQDPETNSPTSTNKSSTSGESIHVNFNFVSTDVTEAIISESPTFVGANWQAVDASSGSFTLPFTLSSGSALKTVYAKVRNAGLTEESNQATITLDETAPSLPTNFTLTPGVEKIDLSWENPSDSDFGGVQLRYSLIAPPTNETEGTLLADLSGSPGLTRTYEHTGLTAGETYYYSLFAYDQLFNYANAVSESAVPLSSLSGFTLTTPTNVVAGENFLISVTAIDADGNTDATYTSTPVITLNYIEPAIGTLTLSETAILLTEGIGNLNLNYPDAGTFTISVTDTLDNTVTGTSNIIQSRPSLFSVTTSSNKLKANEPFSLTVSPLNVLGGVTPNYSGTATLAHNLISPIGGSGALNHSSLNLNGTTTLTGLRFNNCGTIDLSVTDTTTTPGVSITGHSSQIVLSPASFTLQLSAPSASRNFFYIAEDFDLTATAQSFSGATTTNFQGNVVFTSELGLNIENFTNSFTSLDQGVHVFTGVQSQVEAEDKIITVKDATDEAIIGTSDALSIKDGRIRVVDLEGQVGLLSGVVLIEDNEGNIIEEDDSTQVTLQVFDPNGNGSATSNIELLPVTVSKGQAAFTVNNSEAEQVTLTPISDPVLESVQGTATFSSNFQGSTIGEGGIPILFWKELKNEPAPFGKGER